MSSSFCIDGKGMAVLIRRETRPAFPDPREVLQFGVLQLSTQCSP